MRVIKITSNGLNISAQFQDIEPKVFKTASNSYVKVSVHESTEVIVIDYSSDYSDDYSK